MEGTDVEADDDGVEPVPMGKSQKEIDDEIKKRKEKQKFLDDVGVIVSMISITLIAVIVVSLKILVFYQEVDESISTFIPIDQKKGSKIKYTGHGFIPCNGLVPCPYEEDANL